MTESDNQTAELLVKEMGRKDGGAPTTAAGVAAVTARDGGARAGPAGHPGGRRLRPGRGQRGELPAAHEHPRPGGPDGLIADGLAIAGKTGTLAGRFLDSPARERLRAKTGTLNTVTALTGFVHATQGPVLTFAYIANGEYVNRRAARPPGGPRRRPRRLPAGPTARSVGPRDRQ